MSEWQPIETAPRNGTQILIINRWGGIRSVMWGKPLGFGTGTWCWIPNDEEDTGLSPRDMTHWMPLPEPPK